MQLRALAFVSVIVAVAHAYNVFTAGTGVGSAMDAQHRPYTNEFYVPSRDQTIYKVVRNSAGDTQSSFTSSLLMSFSGPTACGLDTSGNLYVSEQSSHTVKKVVLSSLTVTTLATGFQDPYSAIYNPSNGLLYVNSLSQNKVFLVNAVSGATTLYAGTGGSGGSNGPRLSTAVGCPLYGDLTSNGDWYINSYCTGTIRRVEAASGNLVTVAGVYGSSGNVDGAALTPVFSTNMRGLTVAGDDSIIVADMSNYKIRRVASGFVTTLAGTGGSSDVDGPALSAQFGLVWGLTAHVPGYVYFSDYSFGKMKGLQTQIYSGETYCCQPFYNECTSLHNECNSLDTSILQAACNADASLCDVYSNAVAVKNACNRLASACDALISIC